MLGSELNRVFNRAECLHLLSQPERTDLKSSVVCKHSLSSGQRKNRFQRTGWPLTLKAPLYWLGSVVSFEGKKELLLLLVSSLYLSWSKARSNFRKSITLWFYYLNSNYKGRIDQVEKCHSLPKAALETPVTGRIGTQASFPVLRVTLLPVIFFNLPKTALFHI